MYQQMILFFPLLYSLNRVNMTFMFFSPEATTNLGKPFTLPSSNLALSHSCFLPLWLGAHLGNPVNWAPACLAFHFHTPPLIIRNNAASFMILYLSRYWEGFSDSTSIEKQGQIKISKPPESRIQLVTSRRFVGNGVIHRWIGGKEPDFSSLERCR